MNDTPITLVLAAVLAVITAIVGGVVVITNPDTLSFNEYLVAEGAFLAGTGLFAGGLAQAEKKVDAPRIGEPTD